MSHNKDTPDILDWGESDEEVTIEGSDDRAVNNNVDTGGSEENTAADQQEKATDNTEENEPARMIPQGVGLGSTTGYNRRSQRKGVMPKRSNMISSSRKEMSTRLLFPVTGSKHEENRKQGGDPFTFSDSQQHEQRIAGRIEGLSTMSGDAWAIIRSVVFAMLTEDD
ncbi:hypothetical protein L2E82_14623 [Cichorium intybus]|uniref:Uncharacterized protein n=1 Tax=Cichorium intybus TaxID=13427 RepID=A0ACB9F0I0_CICIN|nr:hypothetical protein L2E82_14623 [Cichorium intybus]